MCSSHPLQLTISGTSLEQMPLLNCQFLKGYRERRLAHLVLSFITMGYVWQEGEAQPAEVKGKLMSVWSWGRSAAPRTCCLLGTTVFFWKMGPFLFFSLGVSWRQGKEPIEMKDGFLLTERLIFFRIGSPFITFWIYFFLCHPLPRMFEKLHLKASLKPHKNLLIAHVWQHFVLLIHQLSWSVFTVP